MKINSSALTSVLFLLGAACNPHPSNPRFAGFEDLPSFTIMSADSTTVLNTDRLPNAKQYIFMYFDPSCEHCQKVTQNLVDHRQEFENTYVYMITDHPAPETVAFMRYFHLNSIKHLFVGTDPNFTFLRIFSPTSVPFIAVYNAQKKLKLVSEGETSFGELLQHIKV